MKLGIPMLLLLVCCLGCKNVDDQDKTSQSQMQFDKEKWKIRDPETIYAYREEMLDNLVDTLLAVKKRRALPKEEILDMLGEPTRVDNLHLFYEVSMKHLGLVPFNAITLVIKLKEDQTVDKVLIAE